MRIHLPRYRKEGTLVEPDIFHGVLREVKCFDKDKWQVKISCSTISTIDNLYLTLSDGEMEIFINEWKEVLSK